MKGRGQGGGKKKIKETEHKKCLPNARTVSHTCSLSHACMCTCTDSISPSRTLSFTHSITLGHSLTLVCSLPRARVLSLPLFSSSLSLSPSLLHTQLQNLTSKSRLESPQLSMQPQDSWLRPNAPRDGTPSPAKTQFMAGDVQNCSPEPAVPLEVCVFVCCGVCVCVLRCTLTHIHLNVFISRYSSECIHLNVFIDVRS